MPPPEVLGPLGLTIAAVIVVAILWREHLRADADDRAQRDRAFELLKQLADAWDARNAAEARRRRGSD